jgi:16S rRNA (guanine966-N2)-methyltransferase
VLRITSGILKGQIIFQPKTSQTRPVSEQTRHAIFQVLGDIEGLSVLDLYAGSGALGFEALSLGCKEATFVDIGSKAIEAIKNSAKSLGVDSRSKIIKSSDSNFLSKNTEKYNLIFFDPPYSKFDSVTLEKTFGHLAETGIIITSCSAKTTLLEYGSIAELVKQKNYGDTTIGYYRQIKRSHKTD